LLKASEAALQSAFAPLGQRLDPQKLPAKFPAGREFPLTHAGFLSP
jgi:hypothetical protein